jgi:hypothetical protein
VKTIAAGGLRGDAQRDPVLAIAHELSHAMRLSHDPSDKVDTGDLEDPVAAGNHDKPPGRKPSASDISEAKKAANAR